MSDKAAPSANELLDSVRCGSRATRRVLRLNRKL